MRNLKWDKSMAKEYHDNARLEPVRIPEQDMPPLPDGSPRYGPNGELRVTLQEYAVFQEMCRRVSPCGGVVEVLIMK